MDRQRLWRRVALDVERLAKLAPEGFVPVVEIYLVGRQAPIEAGFAGTNRNPEYPYVRIETLDAGGSDGKAHPDARWIHVRDDQVQRVEICFRKAPPFDFEHFRVLDEDVDDDKAATRRREGAKGSKAGTFNAHSTPTRREIDPRSDAERARSCTRPERGEPLKR